MALIRRDYKKADSLKVHPVEVIDRLKKFKKSKKLSWDEVSSKLGIPRRSLIRWMQTKKMNYSSLRILSMSLYHQNQHEFSPDIERTEELHSKDKENEVP